MFNIDQPTILENIPRIIVIGDVHGDITRLLNCMINANVFSKDLKWIAEPPNTVVVQMGDQVDSLNRGISPEWEELADFEVLLLMDKLDNVAKIEGGRVLSLIGNHEIMNTLGQFNYVSPKSLSILSEQDRFLQFQPGNRFANILAKRNIILKINSFLFCHAALMPNNLRMFDNNIHKINEITRKILRKEPINHEEKNLYVYIALSDDSILWSRIYTSENENNSLLIDEVLKKTKCTNIFIGHNTVENIRGAFDNKVIFTDAALSRAYALNKIEYIDIKDNNMNIVKIDI